MKSSQNHGHLSFCTQQFSALKETRNSRKSGIEWAVTFTVSLLRGNSQKIKFGFKNNWKVTLLPRPSSNFFQLVKKVQIKGKIPVGKDTEQYIQEEVAALKKKKIHSIYSFVINDKSYHKDHHCGTPE